MTDTVATPHRLISGIYPPTGSALHAREMSTLSTPSFGHDTSTFTFNGVKRSAEANSSVTGRTPSPVMGPEPDSRAQGPLTGRVGLHEAAPTYLTEMVKPVSASVNWRHTWRSGSIAL